MTHPLHFLPLGGSGEIGMNLNLYEYGGSWLMCDLGVTFAGEELPGIDLVMPDISYIAERRQHLLGLVLTHAHEDHMGAVPYLWPLLECPVYATPFTAALLAEKLHEGADGIHEMDIHVIDPESTLKLGPFTIALHGLTHSIPEPSALVLDTPAGRIMHTGDWKLDPEPLISDPVDEEAIRKSGDSGILAMVCDSTNVFRPGTSGSEADVRCSLIEEVAGRRGRVAVTTFASNLTRLLSIHRAAEANGRRCVALGRSMWRIIKCARQTGYLPPDTHFMSDRDARHLTPDKVLYMLTGSQGEPNAALSRIAAGNHQTVTLEAGDHVIFSSKIIPGNERAIFDLINRLTHLGIETVTEDERFVHVSGHPNREELARMYALVRPRYAIPVHGEIRHLKEHAILAESLGVEPVRGVANGSLVRLAPGTPSIVAEVTHGRVAWTGRRAVPVDGPLIRERRDAMTCGVVIITLVVDHEGDLAADPHVALIGLGEAPDIALSIADDAADTFEDLRPHERMMDEDIVRALQRIPRRWLGGTRARRPVTRVAVIRI